MPKPNALISAILFLAPCLALNPAAAAGLSVGIDMTAPLHLSRPAASIVVGNPAIADLHIESPSLVFIQGRSFGTTNLIALDKDGQVIMSSTLTVTSAERSNVTLERGVFGRITYACSGRCEPMVMPGDDSERSKTVMDTATAKTGAADSAARSN